MGLISRVSSRTYRKNIRKKKKSSYKISKMATLTAESPIPPNPNPNPIPEDREAGEITHEDELNQLNAIPTEGITQSVHTLVFNSMRKARNIFISEYSEPVAEDETSSNLRKNVKANQEYKSVLEMSKSLHFKSVVEDAKKKTQKEKEKMGLVDESKPGKGSGKGSKNASDSVDSKALVAIASSKDISQHKMKGTSKALVQKRMAAFVAPKWHAPWKLYRVIAGHTGWVRCAAVEPNNEWFATGSNDRTIKIWDLATGRKKLTYTGRVSSVRGICISNRHPYLFSAGEDKTVKCWDLEQNRVVRHYHGHLSAVNSVVMHPTLDILFSAGRDSAVRVWDMRTRQNVVNLLGHAGPITDMFSQSVDPQVVTSSIDSTVRLWDLVAGKSRAVLTHHKKSVRSLAMHPTQFMFASGSADNIKQWKLPEGTFMQNLSGHNTIINAMAINSDSVFVTGGDDGTMRFWDWRTGYCFQETQAPVQPGSLDSENGIFGCVFDRSESRLLTLNCDKTIKLFKEDDQATPETHPVEWKPDYKKKRY